MTRQLHVVCLAVVLTVFCPLVVGEAMHGLQLLQAGNIHGYVSRLTDLGKLRQIGSFDNGFDVSSEVETISKRLLSSEMRQSYRTRKVPTECLQSFDKLSISVLDAFGKPRSGILGQNFNWLGNFDECVAVDGFQHCVADMQIDLSLANGTLKLPILWGICMPIACSEDDIEDLIAHVTGCVNISRFHLTEDARDPPGPIHCAEFPPRPYDAGFICVVLMCTILVLLMLLGAAVDVHMRLFEIPPFANGYQRVNDKNHHTEQTPLLVGEEVEENKSQEFHQHQNDHGPKKQGFLRKFLLCFAVNRSLDKLLNADQGDNSIACLNGIRVLSISWVILSHSLLYAFEGYMFDNTLTVVNDYITKLPFTVVLQGIFAVDTFFFLSGFLLAYLTLAKMSKTNGKLPWGLLYFHRFWRLTPVYGAVILFLLFVDPYIGQGPLWYRYIDHPNCRKYWWRNLLYISNFFPQSEMCMVWSWYLPNDMQFFVISPILLVMLYRFPKMGMGVLTGLTFVTIVIKTALSGVYRGDNLLLDNDNDEYWDIVYDKPYTRIPPYLVGIALGFIIAHRPHIRMRLPVVLFGWLLATAVGLVVVYVANNVIYRQWSRAEIAIYNGLASFSWSLAVGWVVFACKNGYGGWINTFLSWNFWRPAGRLTYTVYLVHPIIIRNIIFSNTSSFHADIIPFSSLFVGAVFLTHGVALLFSLAIEYPFANLEKLLIPSSLKKKSEQPRKDMDQA